MITQEAAELIGMHVGDGTLYKTQRSVVWELRGDLREKEYYFYRVAPLLTSLFSVSLIPKFRSGGKHGCFGIQTTNKELVSFFYRYGFKAGRKTHTVRVPSFVLGGTIEIKLAFLRGYFDTDGCLRFQRINQQARKEYPTLEMASASAAFIEDLQILLCSLNFRPYCWLDKRTLTSKISLAGREMLHKWMAEVMPKNPKHLNKYFWFRSLERTF